MTIFEIITAELARAGIEDARREARFLILDVTGVDPLISEPPAGDALNDAVARRCAREPLSKIVGRREFYGHAFIVTRDVLDPRPDSETLIDETLKVLQDGDRVLDAGTGSGCLLLTLLAERPGCTGVAIDISADALDVARANGQKLDVSKRAEFIHAGFAEYAPEGRFDILVSNPPYIPSAECEGLQPEVRLFDPLLALDGGVDGCEPYRILFARLSALLKPGGHFFVELSPDICHKVVELATDAGHRDIRVIRDLAGKERVMAGLCG